MLEKALALILKFEFGQRAAANIFGTALVTIPLFGMLDKKLTKEIEDRAPIVYVNHQNEIVSMNFKEFNNSLNALEKSHEILEKNQQITNDRLWQLIQQGRR